MTVSLDHADGHSTLRFERVLPHDRERVWRAVTDPAELVQWFPAAVAYEPRAGAPMQFDFGGEHGLDVWPGEVLAWDAPSVFAFRWGEDELRFELADHEGGTRLVFTHAFAHEPGKEVRDAAGWAACFDAFEGLLAGAEAPQRGDWVAHHARLKEALGADLVLLAGDAERQLSLQGAYAEAGGRAAVAAALDGTPGLLVVARAGEPLADGAAVEVRSGTVEELGDVLAAGVLRDPLAPERRSRARRTADGGGGGRRYGRHR